MKYTKNRISRRSRVKHSRKTKYSSSKKKNNLKTKIQRGGDLTSEHNIEHLNIFLSYRQKSVDNSKGKIIFNKYDLQLIALFIWANELYTTPDLQKQLNDFLVSQSQKPYAILANILPNLFTDAEGLQNYIVVSSKTKGYNAPNLTLWIENPITDGLILDKDEFVRIISTEGLLNKDGSIEIGNLNKNKPKLQGAFNYKPLIFRNNSSPIPTEPIHQSLNNLGLENMRTMIPNSSSTENSHQLTHMWFKGWPDHGVPKDKKQFINFIKEVYKDIKAKGGTTLIHCSAGIGRTGVVYLVLKLMFKHNFNLLDNEDQLGEYSGAKITKEEIISELKKARINRMKLVQTFEQFNFIIDVFNLLHITEAEYNAIPKDSDATTTFGKNCSAKNRYADILPYDGTRVNLHTKPVSLECNQYINASHMEPDAFGKGKNVITVG